MHKVESFLTKMSMSDPVGIVVIGCGGTGSHVIGQLVDVHHAMKSQGHPGIRVTAYDDDIVTPGNVGRQLFYQQDIGKYKCEVLIERINLHYGYDWHYYQAKFGEDVVRTYQDITICCVDTKASRRAIRDSFNESNRKNMYIIECGNERQSGQVILGQINGKLPNPYNEYPELTKGKEPKGEGCLDPYLKQDLSVNRQVATWVQKIIWNLLRKTEISYRGVFFNDANFSCNGIPA